MNATTVAVDLAKTVFELAISDEQGRLVERKRLSREGFAQFFVNRPPCRIVMEACGAAGVPAGLGAMAGLTEAFLFAVITPLLNQDHHDDALTRCLVIFRPPLVILPTIARAGL